METPEEPEAARRARWLWWLICIGFACALGACGGSESGGGGDEEAPREVSRVEGFGEVAFRARPVGTPPTGDSTEFCALLADTEERWRQGLKDRRDLAGYDGMIFKFDRDVDTAFGMRDTPIPLTIAWFDANGVFISRTDMEPCLQRVDCPAYRATRPYRYAIEVPRGGLDRLGIRADTVLDVGGACRPT